jgi:[acyl-carrier-protein] S-malonyltransferase
VFPGQAAKGITDAIALARRLGGDELLRAATDGRVDPGDFLTGRATHLLDRTEVLQPITVAVAIAVTAALEARGVEPLLVLGHSLGELSAWTAIGGLAPLDAVRVARTRGEAMASAARVRPGGMIAIATADPRAIDASLAAGRVSGALDVAAFNASDETVLTGDLEAIRAAARAAPGATRLRVAGPWHSPLMASAADALRAALATAEAPAVTSRRRFITNRDGSIAPPEQIPELLVDQLIRPVEWVKCLARLLTEGVTDVLLVPPWGTSHALLEKFLRGVDVAVRVERIDG